MVFWASERRKATMKGVTSFFFKLQKPGVVSSQTRGVVGYFFFLEQFGTYGIFIYNFIYIYNKCMFQLQINI